jgi:hypothetical protein
MMKAKKDEILAIFSRISRIGVTRYQWIRPIPRHAYSMVVA